MGFAKRNLIADLKTRGFVCKEVAKENKENDSPANKSFMPAAIPSKKILAERNAADPLDDFSQTPLFSPTASQSVPYDPVTNYMSPRPEFLRYNPNRRREILERIQLGVASDSESSIESSAEDGEDCAAAAEEGGEEVEERSRSACLLWKLLLVFGFLLGSFCYMSSTSSASLPSLHENGVILQENRIRIQDEIFQMGLSNMCIGSQDLEEKRLDFGDREASLNDKIIEGMESLEGMEVTAERNEDNLEDQTSDLSADEFVVEERINEDEAVGKDEILEAGFIVAEDKFDSVHQVPQALEGQYNSQDSPMHQGPAVEVIGSSWLANVFIDSIMPLDNSSTQVDDFSTISERGLEQDEVTAPIYKDVLKVLYLLLSLSAVALGMLVGFYKRFRRSSEKLEASSPSSPPLSPIALLNSMKQDDDGKLSNTNDFARNNLPPDTFLNSMMQEDDSNFSNSNNFPLVNSTMKEDNGNFSNSDRFPLVDSMMKEDIGNFSNSNYLPINHFGDGDKISYGTRPPIVELLGEFSIMETKASRTGSVENLGNEEVEELTLTQSQKRRRLTRKTLLSSANKVYPSPSQSSTAAEPNSNGILTSKQKLSRKLDVGDRGAEVKSGTTPLRRSSRLQNRVTSP